MTVTLNLHPDALRRLREKAARQGQTLEAYLEKLALDSADDTAAASAEWVTAWRTWAAGHDRLSHIADDSRESIYAERGE